MKGKVLFVGAGPGDPELLTIKALKAIRSADVLLHDDLVAEAILRLAPPASLKRNVGKRCGSKAITQAQINRLMVEYAHLGLTVVRLKGGDPSIFGRLGEEIAALRADNVSFEIIPGITAAIAAAAAAGISLTQRGIASAVTLVTTHQAAGSKIAISNLASANSTLVIYMPGGDFNKLAQDLFAAGLLPETACAIVACVSGLEESIHRCTLESLHEAPLAHAPRLLIVGEVAETAIESRKSSPPQTRSVAGDRLHDTSQIPA